jgi:hypothetical protein
MRYEQYYRHIFKLKKIRDFLHYYRFLIFAITGTAVITSSTMFSIKGLINGEVLFANTITYGESYQPTGTAIFEEVTYEYATVDTDQWDETAPIRVGNYQVRGKAKNNFNDYYYGKTYYYSIVPKPMVVNYVSSSVLYGEKPRLNVPLLYQDQVSDYSMLVDDYSSRETMMALDLSTFKIVDAAGDDVTYCYTILQEPTPFTFLPRSVEFVFRGGEKIFDGTPLSNDTYELKGDLVVGDRYELDPSLTQTFLGSTVNERQVRFFNQEGLDVSHLYDVETDSESLLINKRPMTLRSNSLSKVYDGIAFGDDQFIQETISGELMAGHRFETTYTQSLQYLVGNDVNAFTVTIFNEADEVVNDVYDLELEFGNFSITKRPLTVTTNSAQQIYNGTPLDADGYTITSGELAPLDQIDSVCDRSILNVGEISNTCAFKIMHPSGVEVTSSYDLNAISGRLLIGQRPLTIQLPSRQKVYDGTPLEVKDYSYDDRQLAEGHNLRLDRWTSVINAGTYDHNFEWTILDSQGLPVTSNYALQILGIEDAVRIDKRPLSLQTKSLARMYNANPLSVFAFTSNADRFDIVAGDLATGQTIRVLSASSLTNVGSIPNVIEVVIESTQGNNVINVTSNYELTINTGTLSINTYQSLTLSSTNQTKIYDDQAFTSTTNYTVSPSLFAGDRISNIRITSAQVDVGSSAMVIDPTSIVIRNSRNDIITSNYDLIIVANQGQLTVNKRPLNVRINSQQKTYDGQPLVSNLQAQVITPTSIVAGHSLQITSGSTPPVSVTDFGNPVTTSSIAKVFKGAVDVTANYNLNVEEGTLRINQRVISVQTNGGTKVYDGTPLTTFTPTASLRQGSLSLVTGHQLVPTFDKGGYQPTNVFDQFGQGYANTATFRIIDTLNQDRDVTFNYAFQNNTYGDVVITKRPITLSVIPLRLEYNGKVQGYNTPKSTISPRNPLDLNPVYLTQGTLPNGFKLETGLNLQATDVGEYLNNFQLVDLAFYDAANQPIDERNFEITKNLGLVIQQRPITISSLSGSKAEDGLTFPKTKQISQGQLAEGHTIVYPETPDMILARAEPYINEIYPPIIYDELGRDVTFNYQITYQKGEVVIFKK